MGKGDRRTRRGKIFHGSFGKYRPRKAKNKGVTYSRVTKEDRKESADEK